MISESAKSAAIASGLSIFITYPIDSYRVRKSIPNNVSSLKLSNAYRGFGITAANLMICRYIAFSINDYGKLLNSKREHPLNQTTITLLTSAVTGLKVFITYPGDFIKINKQVKNISIKNIIKKAHHTPLNLHLKILSYMGAKTTLGYTLWFLTQDYSKEINKKYNILGSGLSGASSGVICTIATMPLEIIKISLQTGNVKSGKEFIQKNGLSKLMPIKPMTALYARTAVGSFLFNVIYNQIYTKKLFNLH